MQGSRGVQSKRRAMCNALGGGCAMHQGRAKQNVQRTRGGGAKQIESSVQMLCRCAKRIESGVQGSRIVQRKLGGVCNAPEGGCDAQGGVQSKMGAVCNAHSRQCTSAMHRMQMLWGCAMHKGRAKQNGSNVHHSGGVHLHVGCAKHAGGVGGGVAAGMQRANEKSCTCVMQWWCARG